VCIGESLALAQIVAVLDRMVARFRFTVAPDCRVVPEAGLTLRPKGGLRMRIEKR
jgi:cytochrome P450